MTAERPAQPRIFRIQYGVPRRRGARGRFAPSTYQRYIKVPYAGLFGLTDSLSRAMATRQVSWFRIDVAKPREITPEIRDTLVRWAEALRFSTDFTGVDFNE